MYTKLTDVIAYAINGDLLCVDCWEDAPAGEFSDVDAWEVFGDSETDAPTHCFRCEALIPERLTSDGEAYVTEMVRRFEAPDHIPGTGRAEIIQAWKEQWGYLFPEGGRLRVIRRDE